MTSISRPTPKGSYKKRSHPICYLPQSEFGGAFCSSGRSIERQYGQYLYSPLGRKREKNRWTLAIPSIKGVSDERKLLKTVKHVPFRGLPGGRFDKRTSQSVGSKQGAEKYLPKQRGEKKKLPHVYDKQFIIFDIKIRYKTYVIFYLLGVRVGLGAFLGTIT